MVNYILQKFIKEDFIKYHILTDVVFLYHELVTLIFYMISKTTFMIID